VPLEPDPEVDIELDPDIPAELSLVPRDRLAGTLPLALLLAPLRLWPECIAWAADVVLHAITRGQAHTVLPHLSGPQPIGALAEGVPDPSAGCMQLAVDELIADRGPFAHGLTERLCQPIAFGPHLGHIPQLARDLAAQCAHVVNPIVEGLKRARQPVALVGVRIAHASEPPMRLRQCGESLGVALALGQKRERTFVVVLDVTSTVQLRRLVG
jgi:hypothetical protein